MFEKFVQLVQDASPEELKEVALQGLTLAAILAVGILTANTKKYPEEIRRPGDPVAWPWSK